jgi:hypothetical protein
MPRSHAAAAGGTVALARRATASSWLHDESGRSRFDRRDILRTTLGGQNMEGGSDTMRSLGGKPLVTVMGLRVDEPADDWSWGPAWDTMVMQVCDGYIAESNPDRDGAGYQREGELPADTTAMELTPCQPGEWGRGESDGRCPSRPFPQDVDRAQMVCELTLRVAAPLSEHPQSKATVSFKWTARQMVLQGEDPHRGSNFSFHSLGLEMDDDAPQSDDDEFPGVSTQRTHPCSVVVAS